ncbi:unnamed protein product [Phytophthora fragariaefolia]|uniref:Unnamed protein product n=1 Tax=Phytophthora fragariaefolia TaxID=1490495 RepID=A0A9W6XLV1_9STRA|nr:unnamed protein product [Phytophthora fragariaefolia]
MLAQMLQFALQTTQQQSQQMSQLLAQTAQIQQQILQAQTRSRPARKKSDPPRFEGSDDDDLELWIFSTEQYYTDFQTEMHDLSSSFSDMVFANLGVDAQAWYRDIKISLGSSPCTWEVFKERIRARFCDKDFKFKTLTKIYELKLGKSQQEYTSKYLHLLSQVDTELPEVVKRWFFQQNLRSDTSGYVSRNVPETLEAAIDLAQRFEDAKPAQTRPPGKGQTKPAARTNPSGGKPANSASSGDSSTFCGYCKKKNHTEDVCSKKARDTAAPDSGSFSVKSCAKPLSVKIGNDQHVKIPRREATVTVGIDGFPAYRTHVYVMPIPEGKDMLLGWLWLEEVNPDINWTERTITCRGNTQSLISFRQYVRCPPARHVGGRRRSLTSRNTTTGSDDTLQRFYMHQDYESSCGPTRVVSTKWLKKLLRASDNEFCIMIPFEDSEKADRQKTHDWDALKYIQLNIYF